jgi:D-3-phosphoglycerate dehydrogenase
MRKVLIIDTVHPLITGELGKLGFSCDQFPSHTRDDYKKIISQYEGIIIRSGIRLDKEMLSGAVNLKFIGRVGSGLENIDTAYVDSRNIHCLNSPEGNRDAVGEHATGMLLALMNNLTRADREVRQGFWNREKNRGHEIKGKTIGIIGYGNMGSAFAQRLKGFEANVISWDKYRHGYSDGNVTESTMEDLWQHSDIVSLHVPLTGETRWMADDGFFANFSKEIILVNTSRGPVVDTASLVRNLKSGKVSGAALDVLEYEEETLEGLGKTASADLDFLLAADNVVLSPHIAGWTFESNIRLGTVLIEKIKAIL